MSELYLPALDPDDDDQAFPPVDIALDDPNGLLAVGGSLRPKRLINAYRHGIFPWFEAGQPILWWSPTPRMVLPPSEVHISRSLRKQLRKRLFRFTFDQCFGQVMAQCAAPRSAASGTWITRSMQLAYNRMHLEGAAHSIEVWQHETLVGGLYGVSLGRVFFGESMFSLQTNASKAALVYLCQSLDRWHYALIDCQLETAHLRSMGASLMTRTEFQAQLHQLVDLKPAPDAWRIGPDQPSV